MKIYILGNSASGKSTLAVLLSEKLNIDVYHLDDLFWKDKYNELYNESEQVSIIQNILPKKNWIIEGAYYEDAIVNAISLQADCIIVIRPKYFIVILWRIITRAIKRNLGKKNKPETVKSVSQMIRWALNNHRTNVYINVTNCYSDKRMIYTYKTKFSKTYVLEFIRSSEYDKCK